MTAADKANLLALAEVWAREAWLYSDLSAANEKRTCADELRALVAEMTEPEDNDDGTQRSNGA